MSIKKAYTNLIGFLEANADKKVKTILDEVIEMCSAKSAGSSASTVHRNENGEVTHIRCGFYKQWLPLSHVEFGLKAGSASGFSPMSKDGTSEFSKRQRAAKKAKEDLLADVMAGEIDGTQLKDLMADVEAARTEAVAHPFGRDTLEEALALTQEDLDAIQAELDAE